MTDLAVRGTAYLSFLLYMVSITWLWCFRQRGKPGASTIRNIWTVAWLIFLVHVVLVFELVHQWSHQEAWEHTQRISGFGDGLYLNYAVVVVWTLDVLGWWLRPSSYLKQPRWIAWPLHGFLFFMWVNAAVVFPLIKLCQ